MPFEMEIPHELKGMINRSLHGRKLYDADRLLRVQKMDKLWKQYQKERSKLEYCLDAWWDKKEVEKHYKSRLWYYAHRKLRKLELKAKELHKQMFYLLVQSDGNNGIPFEPGYSMNAESIYVDFCSKYKKGEK